MHFNTQLGLQFQKLFSSAEKRYKKEVGKGEIVSASIPLSVLSHATHSYVSIHMEIVCNFALHSFVPYYLCLWVLLAYVWHIGRAVYCTSSYFMYLCFVCTLFMRGIHSYVVCLGSRRGVAGLTSS